VSVQAIISAATSGSTTASAVVPVTGAIAAVPASVDAAVATATSIVVPAGLPGVSSAGTGALGKFDAPVAPVTVQAAAEAATTPSIPADPVASAALVVSEQKADKQVSAMQTTTSQITTQAQTSQKQEAVAEHVMRNSQINEARAEAVAVTAETQIKTGEIKAEQAVLNQELAAEQKLVAATEASALSEQHARIETSVIEKSIKKFADVVAKQGKREARAMRKIQAKLDETKSRVQTELGNNVRYSGDLMTLDATRIVASARRRADLLQLRGQSIQHHMQEQNQHLRSTLNALKDDLKVAQSVIVELSEQRKQADKAIKSQLKAYKKSVKQLAKDVVAGKAANVVAPMPAFQYPTPLHHALFVPQVAPAPMVAPVAYAPAYAPVHVVAASAVVPQTFSAAELAVATPAELAVATPAERQQLLNLHHLL
jgi:hypothetical protein